MNKIKFLIIFILLVNLSLPFTVFAESASHMRVTTDYDSKNSCTRGIQEAVDSLPKVGGTVYIPEGTYLLHRSIILKPRVKLIGAGKATVLRKSSVFILNLMEDAKKGQNYVVVKEDTSMLKVKGHILIADLKHPVSHFRRDVFTITKIDGKKIYIKSLRNKGLLSDLTVNNEACLVNQFPLITSSQDCIIQDIELGGLRKNRATFKEKKAFGFNCLYIWCGIYPAAGIKVDRCWIHDFGMGIHISSLFDTEISNCRIYNNLVDGIHAGGGPKASIMNNRIYDNGGSGIYFCFGNNRLIVTNNHIFGNNYGIAGINPGHPKRDYTADRYSIISNNIIYNNKYHGISGLGPQDFVITGNIIKDNCLLTHSGAEYPSHNKFRDGIAGIYFYNARGCVITGNRCLDDQDKFPRFLGRAAKAGEKKLILTRNYLGRINMLYKDCWVKIADGGKSEIRRLDNVQGATLTLTESLQHSYSPDATVTGIRTQLWGIFVGGDKSRDNLISNNVCKDNVLGGVLWQGKTSIVNDNVGKTSKCNWQTFEISKEDKSLEDYWNRSRQQNE